MAHYVVNVSFVENIISFMQNHNYFYGRNMWFYNPNAIFNALSVRINDVIIMVDSYIYKNIDIRIFTDGQIVTKPKTRVHLMSFLFNHRVNQVILLRKDIKRIFSYIKTDNSDDLIKRSVVYAVYESFYDKSSLAPYDIILNELKPQKFIKSDLISYNSNYEININFVLYLFENDSDNKYLDHLIILQKLYPHIKSILDEVEKYINYCQFSTDNNSVVNLKKFISNSMIIHKEQIHIVSYMHRVINQDSLTHAVYESFNDRTQLEY